MARYKIIQPPEGVKLCRICAFSPAARNQSKCYACVRYKNKHGCERPAHLYERYRKRKAAPKWCVVCGAAGDLSIFRCFTCYLYRWRYGRDRPAKLWSKEAKCKNCKKPLPNRSGECKSCKDHRYRYGQPRPREKWGIGPVGWCECSQPAIVHRDGYNLCAECAKE